MASQLWWYSARAGGIVAWALLTASVVWGLVLSAKLRPPRVRPAWTLDLHRYLGGLATIFVGVHVGSIILDSYTHFGLSDVLVPFASQWHPLAVAWGVVAMYVLLAVEITSLARPFAPATGVAPGAHARLPALAVLDRPLRHGGHRRDDHDRARRDDRRIGGCVRSFGRPDRGAHLAHSLACG